MAIAEEFWVVGPSGVRFCPHCGVMADRAGPRGCLCPAVVDSMANLERIAEAAGHDKSAAWLLSEVRDPAARPLLEALVVQRRDPKVVEAAAKALATIASEASMPVMVGLLDSETTSTRGSVIRYLGRVGGPEAADRLADLAAATSLAARALAAMGDERAIDSLLSDLIGYGTGDPLAHLARFPPELWASQVLAELASLDIDAHIEAGVAAYSGDDASHLAQQQEQARAMGLVPPRTLDDVYGSSGGGAGALGLSGAFDQFLRQTLPSEADRMRRRREELRREAEASLRRLAAAALEWCGDEGAIAVAEAERRTGLRLVPSHRADGPPEDPVVPDEPGGGVRRVGVGADPRAGRPSRVSIRRTTDVAGLADVAVDAGGDPDVVLGADPSSR